MSCARPWRRSTGSSPCSARRRTTRPARSAADSSRCSPSAEPSWRGRPPGGRPRLLLLDEPSLGLAPLVVEEVFASIAEINARGTSVLLAEQNAHAALKVARRGYVIEEGSVVLEGTHDTLMDNPEVRRAYIGV
jgi:ABC-type cobalamin transport system ATPase subunit